MAKKETINAIEIAVLAGLKATNVWAGNKLRNDPTFPRPIIEQKGVGNLTGLSMRLSLGWLRKLKNRKLQLVGKQPSYMQHG